MGVNYDWTWGTGLGATWRMRLVTLRLEALDYEIHVL